MELISPIYLRGKGSRTGIVEFEISAIPKLTETLHSSPSQLNICSNSHSANDRSQKTGPSSQTSIQLKIVGLKPQSVA